MSTTFRCLLYHGVYADNQDNRVLNGSGKHLSASEFYKQMWWLKENAEVVSLAQIVYWHTRHTEVKVARPLVVITFDDGYANNFDVALPILREFNFPATFFLTTRFLDSERMTWTDGVEWCLRETPRNRLIFQQNSFSLSSDAAKKRAFLTLRSLYKQKSWEEQRTLPELLSAYLDVELYSEHPLHQWMTWTQVKHILTHPKFSIGSHTMFHTPLARVPFSEMCGEVRESLDDIETFAGVKTPFFAYPEGEERDWNEGIATYLQKKVRLACCPTAMPGVNELGVTNLFMMKRDIVLEGQPFPLGVV